MGKKIEIFIVLLALGFGCAVSQSGWAGDEDKKAEAAKAAPKEPNPDLPMEEPPTSSETVPDMSLGEEKNPEFGTSDQPVVQAPKRAVKAKKSAGYKDLDLNMDYTEILNRVDPTTLQRGVLPPALGFRGYRPNMVALGVGDRTPGIGGFVEYSWNRIGAGLFLSRRHLPDTGQGKLNQIFYGAYGLYRFLPFDVSPYFLLGLEAAKQTEEATGAIAGAGVESRLYQGWTVLLGYSYHSTVHKGFMGGSVGWSF